jgi:hypothetical protein
VTNVWLFVLYILATQEPEAAQWFRGFCSGRGQSAEFIND